ncbi:hypothetical protein [Ruania albidiflava]|uniref:hypothetical protein n=1 Tax=Ruania albidiflava TaxID=366586 RepID=UPI0012FAA34D|nr:hypothetical protein [Ruania albidiflava]
MSRGHGVRQRQILERIENVGAKGQYVTPAGSTASDAAALRRAAYQLEREGLLQLRIHRGKLAMWRPDAEPPIDNLYVEGTDGRLYRSPYGAEREDIEDDREQQRLYAECRTRYVPLAEAHGHPSGPGVYMCAECAEAAGFDADLVERLRTGT